MEERGMRSIHEFGANATKNIASCAGNTSTTGRFDLKNAGLALLAGLQAIGRVVGLNKRSRIAGLRSHASSQDVCTRLLIGMALAVTMQAVWAQPKDQVQSILDQWVKSGKLKYTGPKRPVPLELTDEQRAMLTESPELFPSIDAEGIYPGYPNFQLYWMDEARLIMSVRRYDDWRASDRELSKIVIFHTDTGKFEETPYRGVLECFTPERMVVVQNTDGWSQRSHRKEDPFPVLVGRYGEALKEEAYAGYRTEFSKFTCKAFDGKFDPPANENYWMYPLREGDGAVGYALDPATRNIPKLVLFDAQGKVYGERARGPGMSIDRWFYYNTTTNRYLYAFAGDQCGDSSKGSASPGATLSFRAGGGWEEHPTPALLVNMLDWCFPSSYGKADTAAGIVYWPNSVFDPKKHTPLYHRGLYIQINDKTQRFFKVHAEVTAVSPSGCRIYAPYQPDIYDSSLTKDMPKAKIFNVCQGNKK
jgi:hypothetical protein